MPALAAVPSRIKPSIFVAVFAALPAMILLLVAAVFAGPPVLRVVVAVFAAPPAMLAA